MEGDLGSRAFLCPGSTSRGRAGLTSKACESNQKSTQNSERKGPLQSEIAQFSKKKYPRVSCNSANILEKGRQFRL